MNIIEGIIWFSYGTIFGLLLASIIWIWLAPIIWRWVAKKLFDFLVDQAIKEREADK